MFVSRTELDRRRQMMFGDGDKRRIVAINAGYDGDIPVELYEEGGINGVFLVEPIGDWAPAGPLPASGCNRPSTAVTSCRTLLLKS